MKNFCLKFLCLFALCLPLLAQDGDRDGFDRRKRSEELHNQAKRHLQGSTEWIALLDRAIAIDPTNAWALRERAVWEIKTGSYIQCFALLERAIALEPEILGYRAGLHLRSLRNYEKAIEDLIAYDALNPGPDFNWDRTVQYELGLARKQLKDYKGAIQEFTRAIEIREQKGKEWVERFPFFYRGICHAALDDDTSALADFDRALTLDPQFPEAWYHKGLILLKQKKKAESLEAFNKAAALFERYAQKGNYVERFDQLYREDIEAALARASNL